MASFNFKRIAKRLGLEDLGEAMIGDRVCKDCGTKLRFGKNQQEDVVSYCPKCQKIIATIERLRFPPSLMLKIPRHDD